MSALKALLGDTVQGKHGPVDVQTFAEDGYVVGEWLMGIVTRFTVSASRVFLCLRLHVLNDHVT